MPTDNTQPALPGVPADHGLDDLLGAYALDAVDDDERRLVDEYLERSSAARREVATHFEVAALLGSAAGEPPVALWERLEARLAAPPAPSPPVLPLRPHAGAPGTARRRPLRWGAAMLGVAATLVIAVLSATVVHQEDRIDGLARAAQVGHPAATEVQRLLTRPSTRLATLLSSDRAVVVRVVLGVDGVGWVLGEQLPALPAGRTYQLWGVHGKRVLSLGVLGPHPATVPFAADGGWSAFAITTEAGPGVVRSDRSAVVSGTLA